MKAMNLNPLELAEARALAECIADQRPVQQAHRTSKVLYLRASESARLLDGVFWSPRFQRRTVEALVVRQIYQLLGFDENYAFQWRLDHKLIQALIIRKFAPDSIPLTCGLYRYVASSGVPVDQLREQLEGSFVKRAIGYGASADNRADLELALRAVSEQLPLKQLRTLTDEDWIIQQRLQIAEEYRVHTVEDTVLDELTFVRHSRRPLRNERSGPNEFVGNVSRRLPEALFKNSICGWDIAKLPNGDYRVIEINFGGFHPGAGFQCSGFFQTPGVGAYVLARLVRGLEAKFGIDFVIEADGSDSEVRCLYEAIALWTALFRLSRDISDMSHLLERSVLARQQQRSDTALDVAAEVIKRLAKVVSSIE